MKKKINICYIIDALLLAFFIFYPFFGSILRITMVGRIMCLIMLAFSLDLTWGYGGLINMGQGVFFGLGGYIAAISLVSREGVPMYMSSLGVTELPFVAKLLGNNLSYNFFAIVVPGLLAAVLGWFIFSSKIKGIYFSLITMALCEVFELLIQAGQKFTGGTNGIGGVPKLYLGDGSSLKLKQMYYLVLVCLVLVYLLCRFITNSKFGKITKAVKNNEARVDFLGYNSANIKIVLFTISGMIAGFAGSLYAPMNGMISATDAGLTFSTTMIIWLAIGGRGNLTGAAVGCLLVNLGKSFLSELFTDSWQFILGVILVLVVFFMPEGIVGKVIKLLENRKRAKKEATAHE